ncbi:hypothetical protein THASP1DRAFT_27988 [Thamnocephalis sphaerospora]|uniref:CBS domain-containing protein n=1 Tax=Thamnocephalis sphaerospora TaxID=78915 RepID=A0A4P9XW01_9FUNG|nr:hypothetical protein THASP1DRAFT_27988 [Thamnocephalis sphaerospora]|eukprot:RKP10222.1 hypothetical protein THASP1DRAFT_27988 [Thamnocephalis sphaerospora]
MSVSASYLREHTVQQLLSGKKDVIPLVDVAATASVEEALDLLLANDILTLPVYSTQNVPDNEERQYVGFVSAYDLLTFLVLCSKDAATKVSPSTNGEQSVSQLNRALQEPVASVVSLTNAGHTVPRVSLDDSVYSLLETTTHLDQHRALVLTPNAGTAAPAAGTAPCIVTQTDLARFLTQNFDMLGSLLDTTIEEVVSHLPEPHTLVSIPTHTTAWDAFKTLNASGADALAILGVDGDIVAECSATELRGLCPSRLEELRRPVLVYLRERAGGELPSPFTCRKAYTLSQCLAGMVRFGARRVWLVDDDGAPQLAVTLNNLLRMFL